MGRYLMTHSLLASWLYTMKENPYEDMTTERDPMGEFMQTLRREPTPTTEAMQNGIKFDAAVGVSAGVLFGCNYKSNQPGRALRYNIRFKDNPEYMSWRSLLRTGNYVNEHFSYVKFSRLTVRTP